MNYQHLLNTPTSDPTKEKEHCSVPKCSYAYWNDEWSPNHESFVQCQVGIPLGFLYDGNSNVTIDGTACQPWASSQPHKHNFTALGEHNHCRNPNGDQLGVWCFTSDPHKRWDYCPVPRCSTMQKVITMKVLDFSESGSALVSGGYIPESFTICIQ